MPLHCWPRSLLCCWMPGFLLFAGLTFAQTPEERAVESIRREAIAPADDSAGNPLPLASGWSTPRAGSGFAPAYQLEQVQRGKSLLPWFSFWDPPKPGAGDGYPAP